MERRTGLHWSSCTCLNWADEPQHAACWEAGAPQEQLSTRRKNPFLTLQNLAKRQFAAKAVKCWTPSWFVFLNHGISRHHRTSSYLYKYYSDGVREILVCEWQSIFPAGILASGLTLPIPTCQQGFAKWIFSELKSCLFLKLAVSFTKCPVKIRRLGGGCDASCFLAYFCAPLLLKVGG